MGIAIGIIVAVLILIELSFWASFRSRSAEKKLKKLCLGDSTQVDRLIALEQERNTGLNRNQAIRAAIHSLKRDSR